MSSALLAKPVLRGHIQRRGVKIVIGAITFGVINGALYHFFIAKPRLHKYEEFVRTYDPEAHYEEMAAMGYLQCAKAINSK